MKYSTHAAAHTPDPVRSANTTASMVRPAAPPGGFRSCAHNPAPPPRSLLAVPTVATPFPPPFDPYREHSAGELS
ncbi:hypothetical protein GCM10010195_45390 [Kitasatospora griseola]|nr:hypothetical protein GCM10010195_45390 [Kitasatospora griseola]